MQILIISHHQAQANFIKQGLKYENFGADTAFSETDALTKLLYYEFNVIILHHCPPAIDSIQLSKQIQALIPKIPIIIISDLNLPSLRESVNSLKNTTFLIKPFSFYKLCTQLKNLTYKHLNSNQLKELKIKDLILNINTREVCRQKTHFALRNKEFSLLEFFILNQGKILSRNEILEKVWDRNINILTNTVDVHINNLRKKIDIGFKEKLIKTIHGVGYTFG